jgi:hypothetical protein
VSRLVAAASAGSALLAAHAAVNARLLRSPPAAVSSGGLRADAHSLVSVLLPVRDEAQRVGPCVRALLASRDVHYELLILDDGSTDSTAEVVRRTAGSDLRVRVLQGTPLPPGWLGKPHACQQLADDAAGDVLVFVDADVVLRPDGLSRSLALLDDAGLDLVSPYPRQLVATAAERLVQPLLQWSWLTFLPLRLAERSASPALCAANGQLLACRAEAYRAAGGHTGVRAEVVEDVALARRFKAQGYRATVADGTDIATCRMYWGWPELRDGYTKSLWAAFGSTPGAVGATALLAWLYLLPPAAAVTGVVRRRSALTRMGVAGYVAGVAGRMVTAARTGGRLTDAPAHPASVAAMAWLTARSLRHHRAGTTTWKGRVIP